MPDRERVISLVQRAQQGDEQAFALLVRAHQDIAMAYAASILGDHHAAEDAAQEAFVDAFRALGTLREPAAFPAWFRTIVFKHCDRLLRRRRHRTTPLTAALDVAAPGPSADELLENRDTVASVHDALDALTEAEREVVFLYYMGDHSQAAIARFLDVSANAVKTRLYSARQRLRRHMERIEGDLGATRPSKDASFEDRVRRMIQPEVLKKREALVWSPGMGTDVWELFCACITGDLAAVSRLIETDASLARSHHAYRTPMYFAVRENQVEVAAYLLDHGADPLGLAVNDSLLDIARVRGYARMERLLQERYDAMWGASGRGEAVAAALRDRDLAGVRRLLDESPDLVHAGDGRSNQPIHWAAMTRQIAMIDELLDRGADIDAVRQDGARPIQLTNGDYHYRGWRDVPAGITATPGDVLDHLRERGAYVDISTAAAIGDLDRVRELLDADPSLANRVSEYVSYYIGSGAPLRNAAARGHLEVVKLLLERGADPNLPEEGIAPDGHALYSAVYHGHYEIAKLLLERGAYPSPAVESSADALSIAMQRGDKRMIELLCSYGSSRSVELLAYYGDLVTAAAVFAANPSLADDPGALGNALGNEAFVRLMLRYRPDLPSRIGAAGSTPAITELLFEHGMDPSHRDWLGITPLHEFARTGRVENAMLFLDHGADIHARDDDISSTPLAWAAKFGQTRMAALLLRRGARPSLPDDPPWATPRAWARRNGHDDIVAMLEQFVRTGRLPRQGIAAFDAEARERLEAFETGEDALLRRIALRYGRREAPDIDEFRRFILTRLGRGDDVGASLTLDDARLLIAREHGFASWPELAAWQDS